jgi:hypothetical protein
MMIVQSSAQIHDFGHGFAGSQNQGNVVPPQTFNRRRRRFERIGVMVQQGAVQIGENYKTISHKFLFDTLRRGRARAIKKR